MNSYMLYKINALTDRERGWVNDAEHFILHLLSENDRGGLTLNRLTREYIEKMVVDVLYSEDYFAKERAFNLAMNALKNSGFIMELYPNGSRDWYCYKITDLV